MLYKLSVTTAYARHKFVWLTYIELYYALIVFVKFQVFILI